MSESPSVTSNLPLLTIREFLYADLDRARSLMSQIVGGVPEEDKVTEAISKKFAVGVKNYLGYSREGRTEDHVQRSLLDALFSELEAILESEGWLLDVTESLSDPDITPQEMSDNLPPGCLVRVSAEGQLFDAQHLAEVWGGTSVAAGSVHAITADSAALLGQGKPKSTSNVPKPPREGTTRRLEDLIEDFNPKILGGVTPAYLRHIIRIARGMFPSGLHLLLSPEASVDWSILIRLQEGKRYLDAERDILFSRYGLSAQTWTVIGTIGHYASEPHPVGVAEAMNFTNERGAVDRRRFVEGMES